MTKNTNEYNKKKKCFFTQNFSTHVFVSILEYKTQYDFIYSLVRQPDHPNLIIGYSIIYDNRKDYSMQIKKLSL